MRLKESKPNKYCLELLVTYAQLLVFGPVRPVFCAWKVPSMQYVVKQSPVGADDLHRMASHCIIL
jgi:hypothetical protein